MRKVAIFGNGAGGKSTLARRLAERTGLPLHHLDLIEYRVGGAKVPLDEVLRVHADLLARDAWIIDGYLDFDSAWQRFAAADTLVHVDLPLPVHFAWATKRFFEGLFVTPAGWPEGSPMIRSTLTTYQVLWRCHRHLTPRYRALLDASRATKRVHSLRSAREIAAFLDDLG